MLVSSAHHATPSTSSPHVRMLYSCTKPTRKSVLQYHAHLGCHHVLPPLPHLMCVCFTVNLPAVVAGASVAFLLLTLLIAGIIIGLVLLRRVKQREKSKDKKGTWVERIECTEKREELPGDESVACDDSEQWTDKAALHYEQHVEDLHYESTDVLGQGCRGRVEGSGVRSEGEQCDIMDAAGVLSKDGVGHGVKENAQQDDQPNRTPNAVYAVVDKRK